MPDIGPAMTWRLGLRNTLVADAAGAKSTLNDIEQSGNKATGSMNILDAATGKTARGIKSMGTVATMTGGSLLMMGSSMRDANGNISEMGSIVEAAGMGLTGFGLVAMTLPPLIRSVGFANTAIIPAITGNIAATGELAAAEVVATGTAVAHAGALTILRSAIIGVAGGVVLGAAIAAFEMYSYSQKIAKESAEAHTKALKDQKDAIDNLKSSTEKYNSLVDEYNNKELTASELNNAHTAAVLNLKEAIKTAAREGTPENLLAVSEARDREIRARQDMEKGAARAAALPGLINEQATTAVQNDLKAKLNAAVVSDTANITRKYKAADALFETAGPEISFFEKFISSFLMAGDTAKALSNPHPEIAVSQVPMIGSQVGNPVNPAAIVIQNLTVGSIGETAIGDTGLMLKIERKRAV